MEWLIWLGAALSLVGLIGVVWCIVMALRARRANLPDEAMRKRLQQLVAWNMAALMASMLGLGIIVAGIFLTR